MISIHCSGCNQMLQVKDDLVGKEIKCPKCGAIAQVSVPLATRPQSNIQEKTVAPLDQNQQETLDQPLPSESGSKFDTISSHPQDANADEDSYDFLAPAQGQDELGRLGSYRVLKILGQGGMGVVFLAEDPHLERKVALKAMKPALAACDSAKKRFVREAKTTASIKHDHIVSIYQVGEDRGVPFLAMEFLEGESLHDCIKREGHLPNAEILRIGREIAEGLAAAHEKGLIHRDIKPANIWLEGKRQRVKILDFGLARAADDDAHLTQSGAIIGTPAYMAPEQARSEQVDHRCDLFSLGCVLYRLGTGKMPFKGKDTISTLVAIASDTPKPPHELNRDLPLAVSKLVMSLLAKRKTERPASAQEVVARLHEIEGTQSPTKPSTTKSRSASTQKQKRSDTVAIEPPFLREQLKNRRWPLVRLLGGTLALVVLAGTLFLVFKGSGDNPGKERDLVQKQKESPMIEGKDPPKDFTNSLEMKFVWIPPGNFMMGSPKEEQDRVDNETQHRVTLKKGFYMGVYTVTQEQWTEIMGNNPSNFKGEQKLPVELVSWTDCQDFIKKLREKDKKPYRLPSEAEWEYSCRAGTTTRYYFGDDENTIGEYAWFSGNSSQKTHPVGQKLPNAFGLYDVTGNVWQWCQDWYGEYPQNEVTDPQGPEKGQNRVLRGGSWIDSPVSCRSAVRSSHLPDNRIISYLGLRLCFCLD